MSNTDLAGKRLLIAAGGTGGHIYPGLAVAAEWKARGGEVAFVGVPGNLEARVIPEAGYAFFAADVRGFSRGRSLEARWQVLKAAGLLLTLAPLRQALKVIRRYDPHAVLGVGGYVSGPALLAARLRGIPTMILQLDALPGLANRVAGAFCTTIGVALPETATKFRRRDRVRHVGNPIRSEVLTASPAEGQQAFSLDPALHTLLVFGGSLGSRAINASLIGALETLGPTWCSGWQVIHVTGKANPIRLPEAKAAELALRYDPLEYCDRMPLALAAADLVVSRAGATTIAELTARGIASILIPWSGAADNHQEGNARMLEQAGATTVILDRDLSPESLADAIRDASSTPDRLLRMAASSKALGIPDAAARVVDELSIISGITGSTMHRKESQETAN